ncbi:MAG: translocation/assembly module TamB domain-containing protein [Desulfobacterales bacterium]|nr:translocation/assembly module TamB domain-containing protein [Desulfobacterales bacterium]MBF0397385.1 translocation/assembly module TamB domain-containing protein [Desulfobacterales bacterium]
MKIIILITTIIIIIILSSIIAGIIFIFTTQTGIEFAFNQLSKITSGEITVGTVYGRLIGPIEIKNFRLKTSSLDLQISNLYFDFKLQNLLNQTVYIPNASIQDVKIILQEDKNKSSSEEVFYIPIILAFKNIKIKNIQFIYKNEKIFAHSIDTDLEINKNGQIKGKIILNADCGEIYINGSAGIEINSPIDVINEITLKTDIIPFPLKSFGRITGTLNCLNIYEQITSPILTQINASVEELFDIPIINIYANWKNFLFPLETKPFIVSPSGEIYLDGSIDNYRLKGNFELSPYDLPISKWKIEGKGSTSDLTISNFNINFLSSILTGKVNFKKGKDYFVNGDLSFSAPNLSKSHEDLGGLVSGTIKIKGPVKTPYIQGNILSKNLSYKKNNINEFKLDFKTDFSKNGNIDINMLSSNLNFDSFKVKNIELKTNGTKEYHKIFLTATPDIIEELHLEARGSFVNESWSASIDKTEIKTNKLGSFKQEGQTIAQISSKGIDVSPWCLKNNKSTLCASFDSKNTNGSLNGKVNVKSFPIDKIRSFITMPKDIISIEGYLNLDTNLYYNKNKFEELALTASSDRVKLQYILPDGKKHYTELINLFLKIKGDKDSIDSIANIDFAKGGNISAKLDLANWVPINIPNVKQPINGNIKAVSTDFTLISLLVPDISDLKGKLNINLNVSGILKNPVIKGIASINEASLFVIPIGIKIDDISIMAQSENYPQIKLDAKAMSGKGDIKIKADMTYKKSDDWQANFNIEGNHFEAVRIPQGYAFVSSDLNGKIMPGNIGVEGLVIINEADIHPISIDSKINISPDIIILGEKKEIASNWQIDSNVKIKLGPNVVVKALGFNGNLTGEVTITQASSKDLPTATAKGEIEVINGKFAAMGQDFIIDQGKILFLGGPIDNPAIDFKAVKIRGDVKVGVMATGTLKNPKIQLFSDPPMDNADILAYLILNRPIYQASKTEGKQLYQQAASFVGLAGAEMLAQKIASKFGISDLRIESGKTINDTSVVLGTNLSPRLYVSYIVGLLNNINTFCVRYKLSNNWTVETKTGETSSADIKYTFEK